jgi:gluconokinase
VVVIVMGVAGSGKTTIASELARTLGWEFLDADSLHSPANVAKMHAGIPLDDADRAPWLQALRREIERSLAGTRSLALACSALKQSYREQLLVSPDVKLVYLRGTFEVLRQRLEQRKGHFMPEQLLASQLETLEEPADAITVDVQHSVDEMIAEILTKIRGGAA